MKDNEICRQCWEQLHDYDVKLLARLILNNPTKLLGESFI